MSQRIKIVMPIIKNGTALHLHTCVQASGMQVEQSEHGQGEMTFTWYHQHTSPPQLVSLGLDICGIKRWQGMLAREPEIARRAFTDNERAWADTQPERLAALWTIKEAFVKALGCGFSELAYRDIALEFGTHTLFTLVPPLLLEKPGEQTIADLCWRLILFAHDTLTGALVLVWKRAGAKEQRSQRRPTGTKTTASSVVLQLVSVERVQPDTRRRKRVVERVAARRAASSAASRLLQLQPHQRIALGNEPGGRPFLLHIDGSDSVTSGLVLSLSHCSGWGAAALGGSSTQVHHLTKTETTTSLYDRERIKQ